MRLYSVLGGRFLTLIFRELVIHNQHVLDHVDIALSRVDSAIDEIKGCKNITLPPGSHVSAVATVGLLKMVQQKAGLYGSLIIWLDQLLIVFVYF